MRDKVTQVAVAATSAYEHEVVVEVAGDGRVFMDGTFIGTVFKGQYTVQHKAAGHRGRVLRYAAEHNEWCALTADKTANTVNAAGFSDRADFRGGDWKQSRKKNSRKAACAFLVAVAKGVEKGRAEYFFWSRTG